MKTYTLHDFIIKTLLSYTPILKQVDVDTFLDYYEQCLIDYFSKEIEIQYCKDEIN